MARSLWIVVIACALVSLGTLTAAQDPSQGDLDSSWPRTAIAGVWHLVVAEADETNLPDHRLDMRIDLTPQGIRAVVLSRTTGEDHRAYHKASFDGRILHLQAELSEPARDMGLTQANMPLLLLAVDGRKLVGSWHRADGTIGAAVKLVSGRSD